MAINPNSSQKIAILASGFVTVVFGVVCIIFSVAIHIWSGLVIAALAIALFLITFLSAVFLLRRYIPGRFNDISKNLEPSANENKSHAAAATKDISAPKVQPLEEWTDSRKDELSRLKHLANYRREFLGNVSHELKTPIFNIEGYVLTLLDGGLHDPEINIKYLKRTAKSVDRLIAIVNDLEVIGRLEGGELEMNTETFDIVELSREVFDFLETKATKRDTQLYFNGHYDNPVYVIADRERIRQVLVNLIDNAIKYGRKDHKNLCSLTFIEQDTHVIIEVTDNGIGIAEKEIPRVFERFFRSGEARKQSQKGSGLGLAIVKHIIEAHNQDISVRSKECEGSTFSFTLRKATVV